MFNVESTLLGVALLHLKSGGDFARPTRGSDLEGGSGHLWGVRGGPRHLGRRAKHLPFACRPHSITTTYCTADTYNGKRRS